MKKRMADAAASIADGVGAPRTARVPPELGGGRLDAVAARLFGDVSRSRLKALIDEGAVRVNGAVAQRARRIVVDGDSLELAAHDQPHDPAVRAQKIDL